MKNCQGKPNGCLTARAWQADIMTLELEKARKNKEGSEDFQEIIHGGIELCEAILTGSRTPHESTWEFVLFHDELKRRNAELIREDRIRTVLKTIQNMAIGAKQKQADILYAERFFLEILTAINAAQSGKLQ
jgi:hypothetical protein